MSRIISRVALESFAILLAAYSGLYATEKASKESPEESAARQEIRKSLQAEAAGDQAKRAEYLTRARKTSPLLAEANWHSGYVRRGGEWYSLAEAEQRAAADVQLAEYRQLRDEAVGNPKLLRGLARWCTKAGWDDTARLHYAQVLAAPNADLEMKQEAIKRLDLYNINGTWMTGEDLAEQRQKAKSIEEALAKWRPQLKRFQGNIDSGNFARREQAIKELNEFKEIGDPQIIPVLESFLLDGQDRFQEVAVERLAKFPHHEATEALARYAVMSSYLGVRDKAAKLLHDRSLFESCPVLLGGLIAPLKSQFVVANGPAGRVGYRHMLQRVTPQVNQVAVADSMALPMHGFGAQLRRGPEDAILRGRLQQNEYVSFLNSAEAIEQQVNSINANADAANRRIVTALETATGQQFGNDPERWWNWWQEYNQKQWPQVSQFAYTQQQQQYGYIPPPPQATATSGAAGAPRVHHSCFVAGTLVHTQLGQKPIETIQAGDRVLAQDQDTGELAYKLVVRTTTRPPGKLLRVRVGDESVTTTLGHPFWVTGSGWRMAKELKTGDLLHGLNGSRPIDEIEELPDPQEAYNLVVQDFNSYFVGKIGLLVHDNEFRKPTRALVPGLVEDVVTVARR